MLGEPRDQLQQPRILPPGVVVTEEDVHRAGCGIQAPGKCAHCPHMVPYAGFGLTMKGGCMKFERPWERTARPG